MGEHASSANAPRSAGAGRPTDDARYRDV